MPGIGILQEKRVALLAADEVDEYTLRELSRSLTNLGAQLEVLAPQSEQLITHTVEGFATAISVDGRLGDCTDAAPYDGLLLPAGRASFEILCNQQVAIEFIRAILSTDRATAAVGEGMMLLASAGVLTGRRVSVSTGAPPELRSALERAGAQLEEAPFVQDRNLVTCARIEDLPQMVPAMIDSFLYAVPPLISGGTRGMFWRHRIV